MNIEVLEEYENLVMPDMQPDTEKGGTSNFPNKESNLVCGGESDSSESVDMNVFDPSSDEESEAITKRIMANRAHNRQANDSDDDLDLLVRELGEPLNDNESVDTLRGFNAVENHKPTALPPCLKKSNSFDRESGNTTAQKRVMFAQLPSSSATNNKTQHLIETRPQSYLPRKSTIIKPEKIHFKDPAFDPLCIEQADTLSNISEDSFLSVNELNDEGQYALHQSNESSSSYGSAECTTKLNTSPSKTSPQSKPKEKIEILSNFIISPPINTSLPKTLLTEGTASTNDSKSLSMSDHPNPKKLSSKEKDELVTKTITQDSLSLVNEKAEQSIKVTVAEQSNSLKETNTNKKEKSYVCTKPIKQTQQGDSDKEELHKNQQPKKTNEQLIENSKVNETKSSSQPKSEKEAQSVKNIDFELPSSSKETNTISNISIKSIKKIQKGDGDERELQKTQKQSSLKEISEKTEELVKNTVCEETNLAKETDINNKKIEESKKSTKQIQHNDCEEMELKNKQKPGKVGHSHKRSIIEESNPTKEMTANKNDKEKSKIFTKCITQTQHNDMEQQIFCKNQKNEITGEKTTNNREESISKSSLKTKEERESFKVPEQSQNYNKGGSNSANSAIDYQAKLKDEDNIEINKEDQKSNSNEINAKQIQEEVKEHTTKLILEGNEKLKKKSAFPVISSTKGAVSYVKGSNTTGKLDGKPNNEKATLKEKPNIKSTAEISREKAVKTTSKAPTTSTETPAKNKVAAKFNSKCVEQQEEKGNKTSSKDEKLSSKPDKATKMEKNETKNSNFSQAAKTNKMNVAKLETNKLENSLSQSLVEQSNDNSLKTMFKPKDIRRNSDKGFSTDKNRSTSSSRQYTRNASPSPIRRSDKCSSSRKRDDSNSLRNDEKNRVIKNTEMDKRRHEERDNLSVRKFETTSSSSNTLRNESLKKDFDSNTKEFKGLSKSSSTSSLKDLRPLSRSSSTSSIKTFNINKEKHQTNVNNKLAESTIGGKGPTTSDKGNINEKELDKNTKNPSEKVKSSTKDNKTKLEITKHFEKKTDTKLIKEKTEIESKSSAQNKKPIDNKTSVKLESENYAKSNKMKNRSEVDNNTVCKTTSDEKKEVKLISNSNLSKKLEKNDIASKESESVEEAKLNEATPSNIEIKKSEATKSINLKPEDKIVKPVILTFTKIPNHEEENKITENKIFKIGDQEVQATITGNSHFSPSTSNVKSLEKISDATIIKHTDRRNGKSNDIVKEKPENKVDTTTSTITKIEAKSTKTETESSKINHQCIKTAAKTINLKRDDVISTKTTDSSKLEAKSNKTETKSIEIKSTNTKVEEKPSKNNNQNKEIKTSSVLKTSRTETKVEKSESTKTDYQKVPTTKKNNVERKNEEQADVDVDPKTENVSLKQTKKDVKSNISYANTGMSETKASQVSKTVQKTLGSKSEISNSTNTLNCLDSGNEDSTPNQSSTCFIQKSHTDKTSKKEELSTLSADQLSSKQDQELSESYKKQTPRNDETKKSIRRPDLCLKRLLTDSKLQIAENSLEDKRQLRKRGSDAIEDSADALKKSTKQITQKEHAIGASAQINRGIVTQPDETMPTKKPKIESLRKSKRLFEEANAEEHTISSSSEVASYSAATNEQNVKEPGSIGMSKTKAVNAEKTETNIKLVSTESKHSQHSVSENTTKVSEARKNIESEQVVKKKEATKTKEKSETGVKTKVLETKGKKIEQRSPQRNPCVMTFVEWLARKSAMNEQKDATKSDPSMEEEKPITASKLIEDSSKLIPTQNKSKNSVKNPESLFSKEPLPASEEMEKSPSITTTPEQSHMQTRSSPRKLETAAAEKDNSNQFSKAETSKIIQTSPRQTRISTRRSDIEVFKEVANQQSKSKSESKKVETRTNHQQTPNTKLKEDNTDVKTKQAESNISEQLSIDVDKRNNLETTALLTPNRDEPDLNRQINSNNKAEKPSMEMKVKNTTTITIAKPTIEDVNIDNQVVTKELSSTDIFTNEADETKVNEKSAKLLDNLSQSSISEAEKFLLDKSAEQDNSPQDPENQLNIKEPVSLTVKKSKCKSNKRKRIYNRNPIRKRMRTEIDILKESMPKDMRESGIDLLIRAHSDSPRCLTKRSIGLVLSPNPNTVETTPTTVRQIGVTVRSSVRSSSPRSGVANTSKSLPSPNLLALHPTQISANEAKKSSESKIKVVKNDAKREKILKPALPMKCRKLCVRLNRSVVRLYLKTQKEKLKTNQQIDAQHIIKNRDRKRKGTQPLVTGRKRVVTAATTSETIISTILPTENQKTANSQTSTALKATQKTSPQKRQKMLATSKVSLSSVTSDETLPTDSVWPSTTIDTQQSDLLNSSSLLTPMSVAPVQGTPSANNSRRRGKKKATNTTPLLTTVASTTNRIGKVATVEVLPPRTLQTTNSTLTEALTPEVPIAPKTELDDFDPISSIGGYMSSSTLNQHRQNQANQSPLSTIPVVISGATSHSLPPVVLDNAGTRLYSYLHPKKYVKNHGCVMLDYCCPNLDGPMIAIDPTRPHAKVDAPVRELPAYITMETRLVTRDELDRIPAAVRNKVQRLASGRQTQQTKESTLSLKSANILLTSGAITTMSAPTPNSVSSLKLSALQKQLPSTTTLTAKSISVSSDVGFENTTTTTPVAAPTAIITPTTFEEMRAKNRQSLKKYDVLMKKHFLRISSLTYLERQNILEALVNTTQLMPRDIDNATRLLQEYVTQMTLVTATEAEPIATLNNASARAATMTTTTTTMSTYTSTTETPAATPVNTYSSTKRASKSNPAVMIRKTVPIYNTEKTIIGYQVQTMPESNYNSNPIAKATTFPILPTTTASIDTSFNSSTDSTSSMSTRRSGVFLIDNSKSKANTPTTGNVTPTGIFKPTTRHIRILTPTTIATSATAGTVVTRSSRGISQRQNSTPPLSSPNLPTSSTVSLRSTSTSLLRLPTLTRNPHLPPIDSKNNFGSSQGTTALTTFQKRITRKSAVINKNSNNISAGTCNSPGQLIVVRHDLAGNPLAAKDESILPDVANNNTNDVDPIKSETIDY